MSYLCPLCLKQLTEEERLIRVCTAHPPKPGEQPPSFPCGDELEEKMFCPQGGSCNGAIEIGVFLSHVNCEAKNPFWKNNAVDMPGSEGITFFQLDTEEGGDQKVNHWQIRVLRAMPRGVPDMWFPLMLLRAMSEDKRKVRGKRLSALVELAGTTQVGKSVLAMQSMEYDGYVPTGESGRHVDVAGYMFARLMAGQNPRTSQFLANLYLSQLMRLNKAGLFEIPPTKRMPGDIKVAFIAPSKISEEEHADADGPPPPQRETGLFAQVWENFKLIVKGTREAMGRDGTHPFWYTVAFYDAAGEEFLEDSTIPLKIERAVDKVAVLVDAAEIFGLVEGDSISVAKERIRAAKGQNLSTCLVVTKLDLLMDRLPEDEQKAAHKIAEDLKAAHGEARTLLTKWLDRGGRHNPSVNELKNRLDDVERVFFVWTVDLPSKARGGMVQASESQPRSFGLAKFICWCLNIEWKDINQSK